MGKKALQGLFLKVQCLILEEEMGETYSIDFGNVPIVTNDDYYQGTSIFDCFRDHRGSGAA